MLPAIAFCPSPPLLVPEVAAGAAPELGELRTACADAVSRLYAAEPDEVLVIATGPVTERFPPGTVGSLSGYGVPLTVRLPGPAPRPGDHLPPALTLGAWLLADSDVPCPAWSLGPDADPAELDRPDRRRALLVMGDGSARRSERAPGYVDPRAADFDAGVATALGSGDPAALRALDPALGADLLAAGVPVWRALGAALTDPCDAELLYDAAPYGVGYFVASWTVR